MVAGVWGILLKSLKRQSTIQWPNCKYGVRMNLMAEKKSWNFWRTNSHKWSTTLNSIKKWMRLKAQGSKLKECCLIRKCTGSKDLE